MSMAVKTRIDRNASYGDRSSVEGPANNYPPRAILEARPETIAPVRGRQAQRCNAWFGPDRSQIVRRQAGVFSDAGEHSRADFVVIVKSKNHV